MMPFDNRRTLTAAGLLIAAMAVFCAGCAQTVQQVNPNRALAERNLGEAFLRQGEYTEALKAFLKAEQLNPDDPILQDFIGLTYLGKNKPELAVPHFKKAVRLNKDYGPAWNNLGTAYLMMDQYDAAIECFMTLTGDVLYATPHYPLSNLGLAYFKKGDYELSARFYRRSLEEQPNFAIALAGLGRTMLARGRLAEAITHLEAALDVAPGMMQAYFELGRAYELYGDYRKAADAYYRLLEMNPTAEQAARAREAIDRLR